MTIKISEPIAVNPEISAFDVVNQQSQPDNEVSEHKSDDSMKTEEKKSVLEPVTDTKQAEDSKDNWFEPATPELENQG